MAIQELDELFGMFSTPEDRSAFEQLLERAPAVRDRVTSGEDLQRSLLDGDQAAAARIEARKQQAARLSPPPAGSPPPPPTPGIDPTQLESMLEAKLRTILPSMLKNEYEKQDFNDRVKGLVKTTADEMVPGLITRTTKTADEIFTIRSSHQSEFGKPLDTAALGTFIEEAAKRGKSYDSYVDAHNDFVQEDRVNARIAKGIADGREADRAKSTPVPGGTLATGTSQAARFMQANKMSAADTSRGTAIDEGAQALRRMVASRAE